MLLGQLIDQFVAPTCAGCGIESVALCAHCVHGIDQEPLSVMPRFGKLPVYGAGVYADVLRNVIVAFKEHDRRDIAPVLGLLLSRAIVAGLADMAMSSRPVLLIPVPSRRAARRKRGHNHVAVLGEYAARYLCQSGIETALAEVLETSGRGDQVGRSASGRRRHVHGTHRVRRQAVDVVGRWPGRARVVIVDDLVTTGATVAESARALRTFQITPDLVSAVGITGAVVRR